MSRHIIITSALLLALAAVPNGTAGGTGPDARALLEKSDRVRNGWPSFTVRIAISTFEGERRDEEHVYQVYQKGTEKTFVEFLSPREKGSQLLMLGDDMWIYLPDTSRPIRITPLERLTGNAANGDVARTNYAQDYDAAYIRGEPVDGVECHLLELTARRKGSTYQRIHYWLRTRDARPVKADYFLASGKHIKSATFDEYLEQDGRVLLKRMTIHDRIRANSRSVLQYEGFAPRKLPDKLFHQGGPGRF